MTATQDPIAHAARLLREAAEELRQAHTYHRSEGWENETDAKAAYDEHMAAAQALEDWEAAAGAGGVQALSAAQAVHASVKGAMWFTKKPVTIQAIQWTGDNLREVITFTDGPPDTRSHHAGMAWDAYRDLVARDGLKIYTLEGKMLASPGDWIIRGVKGELYPCKPDIFQETYAAASPTPPVEQQAAKVAPAIGDELRDTLVAVSAAIAERDDRAAQKMIREILAASPTPPAEQQAPATGGYVQPVPDKCDRITWRGRYYHLPLTAQAALKAAPGDALDEALRERDDAEDFIDATLDEVLGHERPGWSSSYGRADALNDVQERMTALHKPAVDKAWGQFQSAKAAPQQEAQEPCPTCAALARTVMLDQVSFDRKPDCYGIRQITDDEGVEEWEDIRTSPDVAREEANDMMATGRGEIYEVVPLWTTPQPAPAPLSEMPYEKRKAIQEGEQIGASDAWFHARLNMLDTLDRRNVFRAGFDRGWNAALAVQGGK